MQSISVTFQFEDCLEERYDTNQTVLPSAYILN